ncbi:carboxy terminal-processing peptidase [Sphingobacterium lumbrici]|uniref:carboxy terminal-processing peptidase n=1 Tax=Sphingobacterium lumbrici TaxID=2559600 RepID=UPI0011299CB9|nr:carboxy terminal-processing peptidase [Sphingobacterium lumbrici]
MKRKLNYLIPLFMVIVGMVSVHAQSRKEQSRFDSIAHISAKIAKKIHYTCNNVDDTFSKTLFNDYLSTLDSYHGIFLQGDVEDLRKKYETRLDDEFNGAPLRFFFEVDQLFRKRLKKMQPIWDEILSSPLDLTKREQYQSPNGYPDGLDAQKERWRQVFTMRVQSEMYQIMMAQGNVSLAELEQRARAAVWRRFRGYRVCFWSKRDREDSFGDYMTQFCKTLDAHSYYLGEQSAKKKKDGIAGIRGGIGVVLTDVEGRMQVTSMVAGAAAAQSGKMNVGDVIVTVREGKSKAEDISGYEHYFVSDLIGGTQGTKVTLGCERPDGSRYSVTLERVQLTQGGTTISSSAFNSSVINTAVIEKNGQKTGYILLPSFYSDPVNETARDIVKALTKLQNENVSALVIDLRNNPGGAEGACIAAMGEFLSRSPLFQNRKKDGELKILTSYKKNMNFTGSLVLLVNPATRSCGDMFTQVMQEYGRALVIGAPTGGKGVGQATVPILDRKNPYAPVYNNGGSSFGKLVLTTVTFYGVTGNSVQQKGVIPDVLLPDYKNYSGMREADRKYPIGWDSIAAVEYPFWNFGFDLESVKKKMQAEVNNDTIYQRIAENEAWLRKARQQPVSLNWEEYVASREEITKRIQESAALAQLKTKLSVRVPVGDRTKDREGFLNGISTDIYINTATDAALELLKTR